MQPSEERARGLPLVRRTVGVPVVRHGDVCLRTMGQPSGGRHAEGTAEPATSKAHWHWKKVLVGGGFRTGEAGWQNSRLGARRDENVGDERPPGARGCTRGKNS